MTTRSTIARLAVVPVALLGFVACGPATSTGNAPPATPSSQPTKPNVPKTTAPKTTAPKTTAPKPTTAKPTTPKATTPKLTESQQQAIGSAESYLETAPFSRQGLIQQLSSDAGEGFSKADATYAVDHIQVDWNEQAAKAAKAYLEMTHFSRKGLIEQLESSAGDGYTHAQAVYGVTKAGL